MKKLLATAVCAFAFAVFADYSVWNPNGSGNWSDPSRWQNGNAPAFGGDVLIDGAEAYITDADYALLKSLTRLRFCNGGSLDMRFNEDHADFSVNTIMDYSGGKGGTLIKSGTGLLVHTGVANGFNVDRFVVTGGILQLDYAPGQVVAGTPIAQNIYGAYGDGILVFNASFSGSSVTKVKINGLVGDGAVSNNLSSMQFEFTGGTREEPCVFSGTLGGKIQATFRSGCQCFTKPERAGIDTANRIFGGFAGVSKIGASSGEAGSLGVQEYIARFQGEGGGIVYLGDGETTAKKIAFDNGARSATLDAGANGGVTFSGDFDASACDRVIPLAIDGSNAAPATIQSAFTGASTTTFPIVKKGTGTWRFSNAARDYIGSVTVEDGTLEYASMSEAGTACSLGKAERLTLPEAKTYASSTPVPWAFSLGTHSTTGALAYVGSTDFSCTTRPFAVGGTGVVRSGTASASIHYAGATSRDNDGVNTLVLDGSGTCNNTFSDVTNGVGALAVEKRGAGTWTLGGEIDLAGGVAVRGGTLRLANGPYRWFRFNVTNLWDGTDRYLQLQQFGLFAADGSQCNLNLSESGETKGKDYRIATGECIWNHNVTLSSDTRTLEKIFNGSATTGMVSAQRSGTSSRPTPDNSSTWVSFTVRVSDDALPVAYYDLQSQQGSKNQREPKGWFLEASRDGRKWDVVDTKSNEGVASSGKCWYSSGSTDFDAAHPGYAIPEPPAQTVNVGSVTLAGGTLQVDSPITVSNLTIDAATGGTLGGFSFAPSGILDVVNVADPKAKELALPVSFADCANISNLENWTLRLNGMPSAKSVRASDAGLSICAKGFVLSFR